MNNSGIGYRPLGIGENGASSDSDTRVRLGNVEFKNPVLVASGTFGYGAEAKQWCDIGELGGVVTKSVSWKPRMGNPPHRIIETASGMLNSIGLANVGVHTFVKEKLPYLAQFDTKIIANIAVCLSTSKRMRWKISRATRLTLAAPT